MLGKTLVQKTKKPASNAGFLEGEKINCGRPKREPQGAGGADGYWNSCLSPTDHTCKFAREYGEHKSDFSRFPDPDSIVISSAFGFACWQNENTHHSNEALMDWQPAKVTSKIFFDRHELHHILAIYGRMVAAGEWRDYAMDALSDCALFSVYRRTSETPLYQIEKRPANARRQGAYAVHGADGRTLRRGHDLKRVLAVLEPKRMQLVSDA